MAYYFYGIRAVFVAGLSVLSSVIFDYLACTAMRKKYDWSDVSPIMSGLLLALLMPASVPYTVMAFSAAFMSTVCKHAFGGNKNLIFCPVCIAYLFTTLCFPSEIMRYPVPVPFGSVSTGNIVTDTLTRSYTYYLDSGASSTFSLLDLIWGKIAGPMGGSAILIILISAVALYFFGDIPATVFFTGFGAHVLINVIFPVGEAGWYAVLNSLVAGSYFFVLTFLACDPRYVPKRAFSQVLYGLLFAGGSYLIRIYSGVENGAIVALPILCIFRDELDRLTDASERLIHFIWKWIKLISAKIAETAVKLAAKGFDGICELIAIKISDQVKRREDKKEAESADEAHAESAAENGDISPDESEAASDSTSSDTENAVSPDDISPNADVLTVDGEAKEAHENE